MATDPVKLPPGFTLDQPPAVDAPAPAGVKLPPGFTLDTPSSGVSASWDEQPSAASRFVSNVAKNLDPRAMARSVAQIVAHPVDTYNQDKAARQQIAGQAREQLGSGNVLEGTANELASYIPLLGPQLHAGGEQINSGDVAGGIGNAVGMGIAARLPELVGAGAKAASGPLREAAGGVADRMYQSALKPRTTLGADKIAKAVQTGLDEGIPVNAPGVDKLAGVIDSVNSQIGDVIQKAGPARQISPSRAVKNLAETEADYAWPNSTNPGPDLAKIGAEKEAFLDNLRSKPGAAVRNMTADEAQSAKVGTYQEIRTKSGNFELDTATKAAKGAIARGLKESLAEAFPELGKLNARDSGLLTLEPLLDRAVARVTNHNMIGIGTPIVGGAVAAAKGGVAGAAAALLKHVIDNPAFKSKLAIAIHRASDRAVSIPAAQTRIGSYLSALGDTASVVKGDFSGQQTYPKAAENDQPQDAPAMNTAMEMPAGQLSRAANGRFISDKSRLSDFAQP